MRPNEERGKISIRKKNLKRRKTTKEIHSSYERNVEIFVQIGLTNLKNLKYFLSPQTQHKI